MLNQKNDTYLGNVNVKRDGVQHDFTKKEIKEYVKCSKDPAYFCETYLKIISLDKGLVPFKLYPYQHQMFSHFDNNRFSIVLACRQSGKSISSVAYLDEFAFVERANEFYTSTYPVISAGTDTKVIVTSTANGIGNTFHKLWEGACQNVNEFVPFTVNWNDVPGRDEKWKEMTIANTSALQFDQEFGNTFFGTGDTLINGETLMGFRAKNPRKVRENGDLLIYREPTKDHQYIMTVDVCKGRGQDYSTFNVIDISTRPFKQVAVYRNNTISPVLFPNIIYKYAKFYNDCYVVIESNDQGSVVCNGLYQELEYENIHMESAVKADRIGIEMTRKVKRIGCSSIKDILEHRKLQIYDEQTILEISTFTARGQSYEASDGNHDDLMMNLVLFGYFVSGTYFRDLTDIDLKKIMFEDRMKEIDEDVPPVGFIDDGTQFEQELERKEEAERWFEQHNDQIIQEEW